MRQKDAPITREHVLVTSEPRTCPKCNSSDTTLVQRGLAGPTDESDQYFHCENCGHITFEIVSRTEREIRVERISPGRQVKEGDDVYIVRRVLKVGFNEYLVYLRPAEETEELSSSRGR